MHLKDVWLRGPLSAAVVLATGASSQALAQLEEVIVTAQKRVENVQDIPLTINVLSGPVLDQYSIRNASDMADSVPGLAIQSTPQNLAQVAVRGLGTGSATESLDQSVGLFIDGIWAGRIREFQASLFDMERVEVIKGTQTTLLGKNTSLGAISLVTRRPGTEFGGYVQADYEFEYDSTYLTSAVDIPTAYGSYRIAVNDVAEGGYVDNKTTGAEVPERDQTTVRVSAEYGVTDNGLLLLSYQYDDLEIFGDTYQPDNDETGFLVGMDPTADIGIDQTKYAFTSLSDSGDAEDEQESHRVVARYEHNIGDYIFTSLTGWSEYDNERVIDADFMAVDYLSTAYSSEFEQFSQEFRITSPAGERLTYVAGLFYLESELDYSSITDTRFPPPYTAGPLPIDSTSQIFYDQDTEVWSLFGKGTLHISDAWRLTLGLRYTDEQKDAIWERQRLRSGGPLADILSNILAPEVPPTPLDRSEDNTDGSINLQYDLNNSLMTFVSWARGSKSGGFTTDVATPDQAEFDTEVAETTELGVKWTSAGGAALINASLFFSEIDDFQVVSFVGVGFETETIPAETKGMELEIQWAATERLLLGASATYSEAEEQETGLSLPYAPEWSANLRVDYEIPWQSRGLVWRVGGLYNYRDEQYMQSGERNLDDSLSLLDLRLALVDSDDAWEVALVGRNLLDESASFGFDFPFFGGREELPTGAATIGGLNRPLTVALQARYNF